MKKMIILLLTLASAVTFTVLILYYLSERIDETDADDNIFVYSDFIESKDILRIDLRTDEIVVFDGATISYSALDRYVKDYVYMRGNGNRHVIIMNKDLTVGRLSDLLQIFYKYQIVAFITIACADSKAASPLHIQLGGTSCSDPEYLYVNPLSDMSSIADRCAAIFDSGGCVGMSFRADCTAEILCKLGYLLDNNYGKPIYWFGLFNDDPQILDVDE